LVLNREIIVQAPALKGARILLRAPEQGSWKALAVVSMIATGAHVIGTAPKDTIIGNLAISAYDYVISESLGFHVDFDKTLGQQYVYLQRMEKHGFISSRIERHYTDRGPPRRKYRITALGRRALAARRAAQNAYEGTPDLVEAPS
jgi:hypothetical protein